MLAIALIAVFPQSTIWACEEGAWVQRTFTGLKMAGLLMLIGAAFFSPTPPRRHVPATARSVHFGVAMAACLMAYNGWSYVSFVAGEVRDPERNLLRSLVIGMAAVGFYMYPRISPT